MNDHNNTPEPVKLPEKVDELIAVAKKVADSVPADFFETVFLAIMERVYPKA